MRLRLRRNAQSVHAPRVPVGGAIVSLTLTECAGNDTGPLARRAAWRTRIAEPAKCRNGSSGGEGLTRAARKDGAAIRASLGPVDAVDDLRAVAVQRARTCRACAGAHGPCRDHRARCARAI